MVTTFTAFDLHNNNNTYIYIGRCRYILSSAVAVTRIVLYVLYLYTATAPTYIYYTANDRSRYAIIRLYS